MTRTPYSRTFYGIRHKETGLLITGISYQSPTLGTYQVGGTIDFNNVPWLYKSRNEIENFSDAYEVVELDLIEVQERTL